MLVKKKKQWQVLNPQGNTSCLLFLEQHVGLDCGIE